MNQRRAPILAVMVVLSLLAPLFFSFAGIFLYAFVRTAARDVIAAVSPDEYRDISIVVRSDQGETRSNVRIACVKVAEKIAINSWLLSQREFPDFTVVSLSDDTAIIVPIVTACGGRAGMRHNTAFLTDSAIAPTWVTPASAAGLSVEVSSAPSQPSSQNERVVRDHVQQIRHETNWGAILRSVDGQLQNVSGRFSGREFLRISRTDIARVDGGRAIPEGAVENQCVAWRFDAPEVRQFQECVSNEWSPLSHSRRPAHPGCSTYRVLNSCRPSDSSGCTPGEAVYRLGDRVRDEYMRRLGRSSWPAEPLDRQLSSCTAVIGSRSAVSLQAVVTPELGVVLEPEDLIRTGRVRQYVAE